MIAQLSLAFMAGRGSRTALTPISGKAASAGHPFSESVQPTPTESGLGDGETVETARAPALFAGAGIRSLAARLCADEPEDAFLRTWGKDEAREKLDRWQIGERRIAGEEEIEDIRLS